MGGGHLRTKMEHFSLIYCNITYNNIIIIYTALYTPRVIFFVFLPVNIFDNLNMLMKSIWYMELINRLSGGGQAWSIQKGDKRKCT